MARALEGSITIGFKKPELLVSLQERPVIRYKGPRKRLLEEKKFQLSTSTEQSWYPGNIPCRLACPVGTDAQGYSRAIAEGKYQLAYLLARQNNPFVSVSGKVCSAPCEPACQRKKVDEPVAIRALKGLAVEKNKLTTNEIYRWINKKRSKVSAGGPKWDKPPRVAVVGAGPAGLSAAHDLALMGYKVTVFEASSQAGGMLNLIPSYKLDKKLLQRDVEGILFLGMQLKVNMTCGRDFSIDELLKEYAAVLLATGLGGQRVLDIPGSLLHGVIDGLDFLREVASYGRIDISLGQEVVVVGGGEVALDAARTALRLGKGASNVHLVCFEASKGSRPDNPREEMSAQASEIVEAREEGVIFHHSLWPTRIIGENGRVEALEVMGVSSVYDDQGRFNPVFLTDEKGVFRADTVILALDQEQDLSFTNGSQGLELKDNRLKVDPDTLSTSRPGVFACGDLALPGDMIWAVASGQSAAQAIHLHLGGQGSLGLKEPSRIVPLHHHEKSDRFMVRSSIARMLPEGLYLEDRRRTMEPVEGSYSNFEGRRQGERCLNCSVSPVIGQYHPCHLCGDCVDVCPTECLSLRFVNKADLGGQNGGHNDARGEGPWVALLINEEQCIHCGACAEACPADAIAMVNFEEAD